MKNNPLLHEQTLLLRRIMHSNAEGLAAVRPLSEVLKSIVGGAPDRATESILQALAKIEENLSIAQYDVGRLLELTEKRIDEVQTGQMEVVVCALAALMRTHPDRPAFSEAFSKIWEESSAANTYQDIPSARWPMMGLLTWLEHYGEAVLPTQSDPPKH